MARPTLSSLLYTQIVGRGLRNFKGKKYLNLIEIEGIVAPNVTLCSAPCLFGIDLSLIPEKDRDAFNKKRLTEMEDIAKEILDEPENWVFSQRNAKVWADTSGYDLHGVNWLQLPDGGFELTFPCEQAKGNNSTGPIANYRMSLPPPDTLGRVCIGHTRMPFQVALDLARQELDKNYKKQELLWNQDKINKAWGKEPPSPKQKWRIKTVMPDVDVDALTKKQASDIIAKINRTAEKDAENIINIYPIDPETPPPHWTNTEIVSIDREPFELYDYDPGPSFFMDARKKTIANEFTEWLRKSIQVGHKQCNSDVLALIARINKSKRERYGISFLRYAPQYSYICSLDGISISRKDLMTWLAQVADQKIPCIIEADILRAGENIPVGKARPNLTIEPLSNLVFQFPDTEFMLTKKKTRKLPKIAEEIRQEEMHRWLEKEKKKEERKAERTTQKKGNICRKTRNAGASKRIRPSNNRA